MVEIYCQWQHHARIWIVSICKYVWNCNFSHTRKILPSLVIFGSQHTPFIASSVPIWLVIKENKTRHLFYILRNNLNALTLFGPWNLIVDPSRNAPSSSTVTFFFFFFFFLGGGCPPQPANGPCNLHNLPWLCEPPHNLLQMVTTTCTVTRYQVFQCQVAQILQLHLITSLPMITWNPMVMDAPRLHNARIHPL